MAIVASNTGTPAQVDAASTTLTEHIRSEIGAVCGAGRVRLRVNQTDRRSYSHFGRAVERERSPKPRQHPRIGAPRPTQGRAG